jgi:putative nucleotidyltransferase with HDIG domain
LTKRKLIGVINMAAFFGQCLWIESDLRFLNEAIQDSPLTKQYPCLTMMSLQEGFSLVAKRKHNIRVVFISNLLVQNSDSEIIKKFISDWPELPIVLVKHENSIKNKENTLFDKVLHNPKRYDDFVHYIEEHLSSKYNWHEFKPTAEEKFREIELQDSQYLPLMLNDLIMTSHSHFNIFIKIGQAKYIKILNAGDELKIEFLKTYELKGIEELYLPVAEHEKYIKLCENLSNKIVYGTEAATKVKFQGVMNLGKNISKSIMKTGISQQKLDHAVAFLDQTISVVRQMKMERTVFKNFLDQIDTNDHSSSVAFLAGIIANEMGFESSKSVKLVGIAALFHDIGLYDLDPKFNDESESKMSPEKKEIFLKHSKHGAEIMRDSKCFDEVACLAVEQHHMRRKGSNAQMNINVVSEVVSVADDFYTFCLQDGYSPQKLDQYVNSSLKNFSPSIEKTMLQLFKEKKAA